MTIQKAEEVSPLLFPDESYIIDTPPKGAYECAMKNLVNLNSDTVPSDDVTPTTVQERRRVSVLDKRPSPQFVSFVFLLVSVKQFVISSATSVPYLDSHVANWLQQHPKSNVVFAVLCLFSAVPLIVVHVGKKSCRRASRPWHLSLFILTTLLDAGVVAVGTSRLRLEMETMLCLSTTAATFSLLAILSFRLTVKSGCVLIVLIVIFVGSVLLVVGWTPIWHTGMIVAIALIFSLYVFLRGRLYDPHSCDEDQDVFVVLHIYSTFCVFVYNIVLPLVLFIYLEVLHPSLKEEDPPAP